MGDFLSPNAARMGEPCTRDWRGRGERGLRDWCNGSHADQRWRRGDDWHARRRRRGHGSMGGGTSGYLGRAGLGLGCDGRRCGRGRVRGALALAACRPRYGHKQQHHEDRALTYPHQHRSPPSGRPPRTTSCIAPAHWPCPTGPTTRSARVTERVNTWTTEVVRVRITGGATMQIGGASRRLGPSSESKLIGGPSWGSGQSGAGWARGVDPRRGVLRGQVADRRDAAGAPRLRRRACAALPSTTAPFTIRVSKSIADSIGKRSFVGQTRRRRIFSHRQPCQADRGLQPSR